MRAGSFCGALLSLACGGILRELRGGFDWCVGARSVKCGPLVGVALTSRFSLLFALFFFSLFVRWRFVRMIRRHIYLSATHTHTPLRFGDGWLLVVAFLSFRVRASGNVLNVVFWFPLRVWRHFGGGAGRIVR